MVLGGDQPRPSIEEELLPQGQAEDAAACNANLQSFDVAGVDRIDDYDYKIDDNNGIIAVADIPQQPQAAPSQSTKFTQMTTLQRVTTMMMTLRVMRTTGVITRMTQRATTTSRPTQQHQPMRTNQMAIKECGDRDARERAS